MESRKIGLSSKMHEEAEKTSPAHVQAQRYGEALTQEVKEKTRAGELQRNGDMELGYAVFSLLNDKSVKVSYSAEYAIDITFNPDGSGVIEAPDRGAPLTFPKWEEGKYNWELEEYTGTGVQRFIERMHEAQAFARRVSNTIPSGNLLELGGIPGISQSFLDVQQAESYYNESQGSGTGDEVSLSEFQNIGIERVKKIGKEKILEKVRSGMESIRYGSRDGEDLFSEPDNEEVVLRRIGEFLDQADKEHWTVEQLVNRLEGIKLVYENNKKLRDFSPPNTLREAREDFIDSIAEAWFQILE